MGPEGRRPVDASDESPHEHGGEAGWTERISFWFFDAASNEGGIATMEFWPGERRAEGSLDLVLPGGETGTALSRAQNVKRADLSVGRLRFEMLELLSSWRITCKDVALVVPRAGEQRGVAAQIDLDLTFTATAVQQGWGTRRTQVSDQHFMSVVSGGWLEQPGTISGRIKIGTRVVEADFAGFRQRVWGRDRGVPARWLSVAFAPDLAASERAMSVAGALVEASTVFTLDAVLQAESTRRLYPESGEIEVIMDAGNMRHVARGSVIAEIAPRSDQPFLRQRIVRFTSGGRIALGLIEDIEASP